MNLAWSMLAAALALVLLTPACTGSGRSQGGSTVAPAPSPARAGDTVGHITVGAAASGVNAGSPAKCGSSRVQFTEARVGTVKDAEGGVWSVPAAVHDGDTGTDLYNDCTGPGNNAGYESRIKTVVIDPDGVEVTAYVHGDNYFELYVNGTFVCRDPIAFTPFNSTVCRFKAKYPLTYALRAVDWEEHLGIGLEYDRFNVGDGGIVARFSDGTITDESWKAEAFYFAPLDDPACVATAGGRDSRGCPVKPACLTGDPLKTCKGLHFAEPADWMSAKFDDGGWRAATVYTRQEFGPKEAYTNYEQLFGPAKFVWSRNLIIDNVVLLRKTVPAPR